MFDDVNDTRNGKLTRFSVEAELSIVIFLLESHDAFHQPEPPPVPTSLHGPLVDVLYCKSNACEAAFKLVVDTPMFARSRAIVDVDPIDAAVSCAASGVVGCTALVF